MSINLLELVKDQVTGTLAKQASSYLGASEDSITGALDGIFPALLGSMVEKGSTETGASGIMGMINNLDMGMLGDIAGVFGGGGKSVSNVLSSGGGIVEMLIGNKMGSIVDFLAKKSGLGDGVVSSLIKLAAPFLLSKVGGLIKDKGIAGLMDLLSGQKDHVKSALPAGMGSMLGLSSLGNFGDMKNTIGSTIGKGENIMKGAASAAGSASQKSVHAINETGKIIGDTAAGTAKSGLSFLKWLLPILLVALLAYFLVGKGCGKSVEDLGDAATSVVDKAGDMAGDAVSATTDAASSVGDALASAARSAFATVDQTAKSALDKITLSANSAGKQMVDFINGDNDNPVFRFNNLTFATGSASIDPESVTEVDHIAAILKAYPNVKIAIEGYTDNTGNAESNKSLSQARAESVKGRLLVEGIDASRLSAVGYGQENPVADNSTEEGRQQNRRIEIKVITE